MTPWLGSAQPLHRWALDSEKEVTRMKRLIVLLGAVFVLGGAACNRGAQTTTKQSRSTPAATATTGAGTQAQDAPPDDCETVLSKADAEAVLGGPVEIKAQERQGSLLAGCTFNRTDGSTGTINSSFRPAGEYTGTVNEYKDDEGAKTVSDLGEEAFYSPRVGFLVKLEGRSFFLVVFAFKEEAKIDEETSLDATKRIAAAFQL